MTSKQYRDLLQRQINAGGCGDMGGMFTPASRAGLSAYQSFRAEHPGLSRAELSAMWAAHKSGGALGGALLGGQLVGGFPGQKAVFAQIDQQYPSKYARKAEKQKAREAYDAKYPGWQARVPARKPRLVNRRAADLYKQMAALSLANPACAPFGLTTEERKDYERLRAVADTLGIPRSARDIREADIAAKAAAAAAAKAAAAAARRNPAPVQANPVLEELLATYF